MTAIVITPEYRIYCTVEAATLGHAMEALAEIYPSATAIRVKVLAQWHRQPKLRRPT